MGLFSKKKKQADLGAKAQEIERNIWELENKQILYLDKMKGVVSRQAEYKLAAKNETDKNMQRHYANLYLNAEKEKEQYANFINEISREIVTNAKMAQLVDTRTLFVELEKMQSLSLDEIEEMSSSITQARRKRETVSQLKDEAIDKALYGMAPKTTQSAADELLSQWSTEEKIEEEALAQKELERQAMKSAMQEEFRRRLEEESKNVQEAEENEETEEDNAPSDEEIEQTLAKLRGAQY